MGVYCPILKFQWSKIDLGSINAGITHQLGNFRAIIQYCYLNNKKLIKPIFKLHKSHNPNINKKH